MKEIWISALLVTSVLAIPTMAQDQAGSQQPAQPQANEQQQLQMEQSPLQEQLPPVTAESLRPDQIRELQQALKMKGFDAGDEDGTWGSQTEAAVRIFQEDQGIEATGQPDRETIYALGIESVGDQGTVGSGTYQGNEQDPAREEPGQPGEQKD
jgi:peptidoglycan hydrolase-like protein with peptidoglycan-binding domain